MKKQLLLRGLLGFPIGIALGYLITILVSLGWGGGAYAPCMPALADAVGSEIGAVMLQALLCGLLSNIVLPKRNRIKSAQPKRPFSARYTENGLLNQPLALRYWSMACAAFLPAPMARITVAAPVTASPPA